nr:L,D-transpeptidase family protein [uncultured Arsenicibacter sp.]
MNDRQRNLAIAGGILAVLIIAGIFFWPTLNKPKTAPKQWYGVSLLHQANRMADSVGIDTTRFVVRETDDSLRDRDARKQLTALLLELRYGKTPSQFTYNSLKPVIDTSWAVSLANQEGKNLPDSALPVSAFRPYQTLVGQYHQARSHVSADSLLSYRQTLNFYRYLNRFPMDHFVIVNLPTASLTVFDRKGDRLLTSDVIAGKADKQTPCMATTMNQIVTYPYWNVPKGIGLKEILPKVQRNPNFLDSQNMQVLDDRNQEVDPSSLDWASFSADNFPYRFRQSSGCHNSLGLLKFDLKNPYAIYLHDTNGRDLFTESSDRFRSHGCVRVQKPVDLANLVLEKKVFDDGFMNRCLVDQTPKTLKLPKEVPVFIVYLTTDVDPSGQVAHYRDIYAMVK